MQLFKIIILIFLFSASLTYSQTIKSLSARFESIENKGGLEKITQGHIIFKSPNTALIKTKIPYCQHMHINGTEMLIHQDSTMTANRITTETPHAIPFIGEFMLATREDFGLSELGCEIVNVHQAADTLICSWTIKKDKVQMYYQISSLDNKIIKVASSKSPNYKDARSILFSHFQNIDGIEFPSQCCQISAEKNLTKSIVLQNIQINKHNQDAIDFELPHNVKIKDYKW